MSNTVYNPYYTPQPWEKADWDKKISQQAPGLVSAPANSNIPMYNPSSSTPAIPPAPSAAPSAAPQTNNLVGLRDYFEGKGYKVGYDPNTKQVTINDKAIDTTKYQNKNIVTGKQIGRAHV